MTLQGPIMLYDDLCGVCTSLAMAVQKWSRSWVRIVGHYSRDGLNLKRTYFEPLDNPEEMFWLIDGRTCYGGRSGILPLVREIVRGLVH